MKESTSTRNSPLLMAVLVLVCVPFLIFLTPFGILLTPIFMMFEAKPEEVAKTGQPILQAICDYRSDHGMFPDRLEDLVPAYLPTLEKNGWWWDSGGRLCHRGGQPHSLVSYTFSDEGGEWRWHGDSAYADRRVNIAGPIIKPLRLQGQALFESRLAEYERRVSRYPDNGWCYANKINFLADENRTDLFRIECERVAKLFPHWWWPEMILARVGETAESDQRFETWVREHATFNSFWYLAKHYRERGDIARALEILREALNQPLAKEPKDSQWGGYHFLFDACKFAYESGDYELVLRIAGFWQLRGGPTYVEGARLPLQIAAELKLGQFESAAAHASRIAVVDRRELEAGGNLQALLQAVQARDTNFVYLAGDNEPVWKLFDKPR